MNTMLPGALAAMALLFLGACASHEPAPVTTSTTTTESQEAVQPVAPAATTTTTEQVHSY